MTATFIGFAEALDEETGERAGAQVKSPVPSALLSVSESNLGKQYPIFFVVDKGTVLQANKGVYLKLAKLPVHTRADGTKFVVAELKGADAAGNTYDYFVTINVVI
jgi:hypothetical protein